MEVFGEIEQGSPEWFAVRMGIPTASMFSAILAKGEGKTRRSYMLKLAGEIITGEPGENFSTPAMERGKAMEDDARNHYCLVADVEPIRVGFIKNHGAGASPDSLIGNNGGIEIKTKRADLLLDVILKNEFPSEHRAQCQGVLWVAEREWIDLVCYWPRVPPFIKREYRDEKYIMQLTTAVRQFNEELAEIVEKVRSSGMREAA